jgi:thiamine pyrophosphokinase
MLIRLEEPYALLLCNGAVPASPRVRELARRAHPLVCADGGAEHAQRLELAPNVLIGDFDSVTPATREHFGARGAELLHLPGQEDTDFEKGLQYLVNHGAQRIAVLGVTGGLLDHTLGNLSILLRYIDPGHPSSRAPNGDAGRAGAHVPQAQRALSGVEGRAAPALDIILFDEHYRIDVVRGWRRFNCRSGSRVSIVPLTRAEGVTLAGLEYPLLGESLAFGEREGTCNRAIGSRFGVGCEEGVLLVFREIEWQDC